MPGGSSTYGRFAEYYDFIYRDIVDYEGDVRFLMALFGRWMEARPKTVLDLGCGTGNHDLPLARRGHRVTGLDLSKEQLAVARRKAREAGLPVRFVRGDMRSFDLHVPFDAAVCMFGAIGYLVSTTYVVRCLRSVRRHIAPGGIFVFEFWQSSAATRGRFQSWIHRTGPRYELIRLDESRYNPRTRLLPIEFRFIVFQGRRVLARFNERHTIRTYSVSEMRSLLRRGGFDLVAAYGAANRKKGFFPVRRDSFRVMAVARPRP